MKFAKKCAIAGIVLTLGFGFGASLMVVSAHHHWSPLDPSTYWSPTAVDEADGNNPGHYFYHDLGKQGGTVIDYVRAGKEKLKTEKFTIWFNYLKSIFHITKQETTPMNTGTAEKLEQNLAQSIQLSKEYALTANDIDSSPVDEISMEDGQTYIDSDTDSRRWASDSYQRLAQRLSDQNIVNQQISDNLEESLKALDQAQSETEVAQARAHIKAIRSMAWNQFFSYMAIRAQLRGISDRTESALEKKAEENMHFTNFRFDPYNNPEDKKMLESYQERTGIKFYQPHGMPRF